MASIIMTPAERVRLLKSRLKNQLGEEVSDEELARLLEQVMWEKKVVAVKKVVYDFKGLSSLIEELRHPSPKPKSTKRKEAPKNARQRYPAADKQELLVGEIGF